MRRRDVRVAAVIVPQAGQEEKEAAQQFAATVSHLTHLVAVVTLRAMGSADHDIPRIAPCEPSHWGAAVWLATGGPSPHADRGRVAALLAAREQGRIHFDGLFTARCGARVLGALWVLDQPGRIATMWGPGLIAGQSDETAQRLLEAGLAFAQTRNIHLLQSLVAPESDAEARHLACAGFQEITQVEHLAAVPPRVANVLPPDLQFQPCSGPDSPRLRQMIVDSYQGSLDCPELDKLRTIEDVLSGYLASCQGVTGHWYFVQRKASDVGVVLLGHHPQNDQLELIYFGILPPFRGQGLGRQVLRFVLQLGTRLGSSQVVTAVDLRNAPAKALYTELGFESAGLRRLFLRTVASV